MGELTHPPRTVPAAGRLDDPVGDDRIISVVIPVFGRLDLTRRCVEAVRAHRQTTRGGRQVEIVVVDDGSPDGTAAWLARQEDLVVVTHDRNRGFPAAVNSGIRAARGSYIVILNNDVVVFRRWLDSMEAALDADGSLGAVGPVTEGVRPGPQKVSPPGYRNRSQAAARAEEIRSRSRGVLIPVRRLIGFCMALRRRALAEVGLFDTSFGKGNFEDVDLCLRLAAAGWRLAVAADTYVHHDAHGTFGEGLPEAYVAARRSFLDRYDNGALISACLIVRDEERFLDACLASIGPLVDEIVVVDTGSVDRTPEIAAAHGARVLHAPWTDDFAAARNVALDAARHPWVLVIDADERLIAGDPDEVRAELCCTDEDAYHVTIESADAAGHRMGEHHVVRLFRRDRYRWLGRLHELPFDATGRVAHGPHCGLRFTHDGYRPDVYAERGKAERNERLALAYHASGEGGPELAWYRAWVAARSVRDPARSISFYEEALRCWQGDRNPQWCSIALGLATVCWEQGDTDRAAGMAAEVLSVQPDNGHALFLAGVCALSAGDARSAVAHLRPVVDGTARTVGLWVSESFSTLLAPIALSRALRTLGRAAEAVEVLDRFAAVENDRLTARRHWPEIAELLREMDPDGWAHRLLTLGGLSPAAGLSRTVALGDDDADALMEAAWAAGVDPVTVLWVSLQRFRDPAGGGRRWWERCRRLDPAQRSDLGGRLEQSDPAVALEVYRTGGEPAAVMGRARCHWALGDPGAALQAATTVPLEHWTVPDALFVAALAFEAGDAETAAALVDAIPDDVAPELAAEALNLARAVDPLLAERTSRRLAVV